MYVEAKDAPTVEEEENVHGYYSMVFALVKFLTQLLLLELLHVEAFDLLQLVLAETDEVIYQTGCFLDHYHVRFSEGSEEL